MLGAVANCARTPPMLLPVEPLPWCDSRSTMSTLWQPSSVRCQAMLEPTIPPPIITTSAVCMVVGLEQQTLYSASTAGCCDRNGSPGVRYGRAGACCSVPTNSVVQILTASIAPVIVISGIGLLLLSITNRYGRAIDRARLLMRELQNTDPSSAHVRHLEEQLRHTHQRARLLRGSMVYSSVSIFFVTLTILSLFAAAGFSVAARYPGSHLLRPVHGLPGDLHRLFHPRYHRLAGGAGDGAFQCAGHRLQAAETLGLSRRCHRPA